MVLAASETAGFFLTGVGIGAAMARCKKEFH